MSSIGYVLVYEDPGYDADNQNEKSARMDQLRRRFIAAIRAQDLMVQEEQVGKHMFVKVFYCQERLYKETEAMRIELPLLGMIIDNPEKKQAMLEKRMQKLFSSEIKTDSQACAPFQNECMSLFRDAEKPDKPILWSSLKCLLVHNILININISQHEENGEMPVKIGLPYLLMIGAFRDAFVLHDPSVLEPVSLTEARRPISGETQQAPDPEQDLRQELRKNWGRFCRPEPIHEIRDYFGEKIAFYFAWISTLITSLWFPAVLGLVVFIFGVTRRLHNHNGKGMMYVIDVIRNSSDNELTPGFAAIICLWGTIFMEVWKRKQISLAYHWHVQNFDNVEPDRPQFYGTKSQLNPYTKQYILYYPIGRRLFKYFTSLSVLMVMVMLVFISVTSVILYRVYMTISFCEKGDGMCDLIHGTIIATLLNTLSIMLLGIVYEYIAVKLTEWENHRTLSEHNDALIIKLFAFQFANTYASLFYTAFFRRDFGIGIMGLDSKYTDNCGDAEHSNCMSLLSFQLLVLMIVKPFPKFLRDVILPLLKKAIRRCRINEIDDVITDGGASKQHYLLREKLKPAAEDFRLGEFTEKMIQYGYLVLFATSFPLAPALALLFNVIDMRVDARRLLWWNRRPTPYRDNDIGIWFYIIKFINVCGVISNAFLIAFNSEVGRDQPLEIKFLIIIVFEHFIFFMKFIISLIIPDVPTWVTNTQRKERFLLSYLLTKWKQTESDTQEPIKVEVKDDNEDDATLPKMRWSYG